MKKIISYTLAETLITLAIIGIIASLTIPSLVKNYQKRQTVLKFKKAYSELEQVIKLSELKNGPIKNWTYTLKSDVFMNTYLRPYFKNIKEDKTQNLKNEEITYYYRNKVKYTNDLLNKGNYIILSDGVMIFVDNWYPATNNYRCLAIDINGYKKPNIVGKDLFFYAIYKDGSFISCKNKTADEIDKNCVSEGICCSAKIIKDGWQIKEDYKW